VPANGDAPHRFTEALPREESWHADCDVCERYRKHIRFWLEANAGRPRGVRRSITDPLGVPSLR
jgi:hypothetical protein